MSKPVFWVKIENIINLSSAELAKRVVNVNDVLIQTERLNIKFGGDTCILLYALRNVICV